MARITSTVDGRNRLIDHLPAVVFEYTFFPDGRRHFTYLSPRCEELLGIDSEVVMRDHIPIHSFIHPDDIHPFDLSVEESLLGLKELNWEGRCKGKHGFLWLQTQGMPVRMEDQRVVYSGIFIDITEKKKLEQQQLDSEQRYRDLIEQLPLGIVILVNGKLRIANAAAAKIVGAENPDALIGMDVMSFIHPDSITLVMERMGRILNGEKVSKVEEKYLRLDGTSINVETSGHTYFYEGELAIQVIFTDITERKKAEASLRKTETLFYQLFQNTPLAVTLLNEEGNVVQINKGFVEMFGYDLIELEGKSLNEFIVPNDLKEEGNDLNNLISSNKVVRTETTRYNKERQILSVIIYGVPVLLHDRTIGIFGMYVDITERKKVEEELKIRNTELDNFVYKVSHDLRAPLSSVLGLAHLASIPGNDDDLAYYVKLMGQKAKQLDHFISDVLSHSKNLKMDLKVEEIDFQKIIDETFNDLSFLAGAEQVTRKLSISGKGFYSDRWRIDEVFRNLISNSIKYRKLDSPETRITCSIDTTDTQCFIFFQDDGIGIDKVSMERIFEMFYRASDQSEGSGLGLYIVKNAVDKLGGKISVESELERGTTFKINLPNQCLSK